MADSAQPPGDEPVDPSSGKRATDVDFGELTLKERIALATAQRPALGLFLVLFSLFAFTFFIALALVYPTVAGLFILVTLVVTLLGGGGFLVLRRLDRM
jgi:hypothetical protein